MVITETTQTPLPPTEILHEPSQHCGHFLPSVQPIWASGDARTARHSQHGPRISLHEPYGSLWSGKGPLAGRARSRAIDSAALRALLASALIQSRCDRAGVLPGLLELICMVSPFASHRHSAGSLQNRSVKPSLQRMRQELRFPLKSLPLKSVVELIRIRQRKKRTSYSWTFTDWPTKCPQYFLLPRTYYACFRPAQLFLFSPAFSLKTLVFFNQGCPSMRFSQLDTCYRLKTQAHSPSPSESDYE